jgi:hypothetical protein
MRQQSATTNATKVARCDSKAQQQMQQGSDGEQQGSKANQQSNNVKRKK